jgi:hypothetical protein
LKIPSELSGGIMTKRTLHQWQQLIEQQQNSELSIIAFCKINKLPTSNFYKYRARLQEKLPEPKFIKANSIIKPTAHSDITLTFGQAKLALSSCEPQWLARLLKALQS